ncbi:MAG: cobalt ECF transporter T component CbiQ [Methermicoccaceae archaeon]
MAFLVDKTLEEIARYIKDAVYSERYTQEAGLLQSIDARLKLVGILVLVVCTVWARSLLIIGLLLALSIILCWASKISLRYYIPRVWMFVPLFTGIIVIPALLNVVSPGERVISLLHVGTWDIYITMEGIHAATFLVMRVATCVSFALLLPLTTRWSDLMRALESIRIPSGFVLILSMTYRYIFLLLDTLTKMLLSRKSRLVGGERAVSTWRLYAPVLGALFLKSLSESEKVYLSMLARGYTGEARTTTAQSLTPRSYCFVLATAFIFVGTLVVQHWMW